MVEQNWIREFEEAAMARNQLLAKKLRPGLSERRLERALRQWNVTGEISPLVALYTWKDGMDLAFDPSIPNFNDLRAHTSVFPGRPYFFPSFDWAATSFDSFGEIAKNYPKIADAVGRYFPIFWNGATEYLVVDLTPSNRNRLFILDHRSEEPIREAYGSFDEFVADAIGANTENRLLQCFRKLLDDRIERMGEAILAGNPNLAKVLRPPLSEQNVRSALNSAAVHGTVDAVVALYSWKDGLEQSTREPFFPESIFRFLPLDEALERSQSMKAAVTALRDLGSPIEMPEETSRYVAAFWDGATGFLAIDVWEGMDNRVMRLELESEEPFQQIYKSFDAFLADATAAAKANESPNFMDLESLASRRSRKLAINL